MTADWILGLTGSGLYAPTPGLLSYLSIYFPPIVIDFVL